MVETEYAELEAGLGHRFHRAEWLERALTHSSSRQELGAAGLTEDNEKLELLGDAVLSLLVTEYLLTTFPGWSEGQLSKSRARLVNAGALHAAARRLGLGRYLRLGRGEEKTGGREKPAVLADAYEAVVAAIYLDAGLDAARQFVGRSLLDGAIRSETHLGAHTDAKSELQEWLQGRALPPADYRVAKETGPDHRKTFLVEVIVQGRPAATASGGSKKEAEQAAARLALDGLVNKSS